MLPANVWTDATLRDGRRADDHVRHAACAPPARVRAYRPETSIAEKTEVMVRLALANSRMKSFFDIQDPFDDFCDEFTRGMNRLRTEHRTSLSAAAREIERIDARRKKLIEMVMEGVAPSVVKDELTSSRGSSPHRASNIGSPLARP